MADVIRPVQERPAQELPPQEESGIHADEQEFEHIQEMQETFLEEERAPVTRVEEAALPSTQISTTPPIVQKSEEMIEVEKIMEEGLGTMYAGLPEDAKVTFKHKGEEAAQEISRMIQTLQLKVKRVLQLLRDWLLTIPKVNRFFLEQEAKIKTDQIVELVKTRKSEQSKTS